MRAIIVEVAGEVIYLGLGCGSFISHRRQDRMKVRVRGDQVKPVAVQVHGRVPGRRAPTRSGGRGLDQPQQRLVEGVRLFGFRYFAGHRGKPQEHVQTQAARLGLTLTGPVRTLPTLAVFSAMLKHTPRSDAKVGCTGTVSSSRTKAVSLARLNPACLKRIRRRQPGRAFRLPGLYVPIKRNRGAGPRPRSDKPQPRRGHPGAGMPAAQRERVSVERGLRWRSSVAGV